MGMIDNLLVYNRDFVARRAYEQYITDKYPDKRIAIVACMDTRLIELLPASLGLKNGDMKIIKNAGGIITHPFGSVVRSLLVAIYELGVEEVMVIGHSDCGAQHMNSDAMIEHMRKRGVSTDTIDMIKYCGIDFKTWLSGFDSPEMAVGKSIALLKRHPLIPHDIVVRGFVMDSVTGYMNEVESAD